MLKTTRSSVESALKADVDEVVVGNDRADETVSNLSQNLFCLPNIGVMGELNFLIPNAKKTFNRLRQAFIETPILRNFDQESHIWIEIDASGYVIGGVLSQLNSEEENDPR